MRSYSKEDRKLLRELTSRELKLQESFLKLSNILNSPQGNEPSHEYVEAETLIWNVRRGLTNAAKERKEIEKRKRTDFDGTRQSTLF